MGYQFVAAVNIQHKRWLHNLLEYHCPLNSTLVVQDQHGLVWSFKKTQEKNLFVVTNMFGNTAVPKLNMPQLVNKESEEILGKLGKPILSAMIKEMKIVYENPNLSMQRVISSFLNQKYSQNLVEENTESAPLASTSNTHQVQQVCPQESDTPNQYTEEGLKKMKIQNLKEITKSMGIRFGRKKNEIIENILSSQNINDSQITELKVKLSTSHSKDAVIHDYYKNHFNNIDLIDKYWYDINSHHKIQCWESKFIVSLLEMGFVNTFAITSCFRNCGTFASFVDDLILKIIENASQ